MAITDSFKNAVSSGEIKSIRIMMKNSLLVDLTFVEFDEMESLSKNVTELYDEHDGRELISDRSAWNDDYMNKLMVLVVGNFSHERLDHLKEVVRYLRPVSKIKQSSGTNNSGQSGRQTQQQTERIDYYAQKRRDQRNGSFRREKIAVGAAVGAVAGGLVAAVASSTVVVGVAVGAIAGGVIVSVATNGERK